MIILNKISMQEKVDFTKNLSVMLKSGITINEALASLSEETKSRPLRNIIKKLKKEVEMGVSLSNTLSKQKNIFGNAFLGIVRAGEASGTLEENLSFLAAWLERNNDLKKEMNAAMLYPKIVFSATVILMGALAVFILPKLIPLFSQLKVNLPLATQILIAFARFIKEFWLLAIFSIVGIIVIFRLLNKIRFIRRFFHLVYIKMPFLGRLFIDYQLALVSQLFSTLFRSGLSIEEALSISSEAATNIHYQESIKKIKDSVNKGTTLSKAMKDFPKLYPANLVNIIHTGEKSGTLDNSFLYLSEFYSKEVSNKIKKLPTVVEPLLLIFIGLAVGFVALSIIMPIYELTKGLGK